MLNLQEDYSVTTYLERKVQDIMPLAEQLLSDNQPGYAIEELCLDRMTEELRPSRYHYLLSVLEEEFSADYEQLRESGALTFETVNLIEFCEKIFDGYGFSEENEEDRHLRYAVIGQVQEYLS
ncbi:DUF1896 domain-containing protein [Echinicola marina]|uniref:DUF1896 family protein n=1 Tax=Echinicola marina TaxID=2859768 RepID=UPI001CF61A22|nr:DUF1896 family protein [Echinicola marina]UCS95213.1 DUF1896 domain-containing protein [Echinicola marina]